jgi:phosphate transport system protein
MDQQFYTDLSNLKQKIDELAIQLLAKAPLAGDLRFVTVAMRISQNLERIGDEAVKIAKRAFDLSREPPLKIAFDLPAMARLTMDMLRDALDAFVHRNPKAARTVIARDDDVDALNSQLLRLLPQQMMAERETITRCVNLITISRSLERIADHATNVAEEGVYLCEAEDIRHAKARTTPQI